MTCPLCFDGIRLRPLGDKLAASFCGCPAGARKAASAQIKPPRHPASAAAGTIQARVRPAANHESAAHTASLPAAEVPARGSGVTAGLTREIL